jgi:hypothetical protein
LNQLKQHKERLAYRLDMLPTLLELMEEFDSWSARADSLNSMGFTTYHGKQFTDASLRALYLSYYKSGSYSHTDAIAEYNQLLTVAA